MRISFVGKGGSGKSTLAALFTQYASRQGQNVVAIDADLNIHLPRLLGFEKPAAETYLSEPSVALAIKDRLRGTNARIGKPETFRKSTPPGSGSHLILVDDPNDPIIRSYSTKKDETRLLVVGTYAEEDIGASCYHNNLAILENVLSHAADDKALVVADMVAGTDAFASTLHAQFDLTILVVEPTWRGIEVYKDYERLCRQAGCLDTLKVVGNKIRTEEERAFVTKHIPAEMLLGCLGQSPYLETQDRNWGPIEFAQLEPENALVIRTIYDALKRLSYDPQKRLEKLWDLHRTYVSQRFITERFGDLTTQIDPTFDFTQETTKQRACNTTH